MVLLTLKIRQAPSSATPSKSDVFIRSHHSTDTVLKTLRKALRTCAPHRQWLNSSLKGRRLRANHLLGHLTYLNGKPDRESSMLGKRLNAKVCHVKCRK